RDYLLSVEQRDDVPLTAVDRLTIREWMAELHGGHKKTSIARKIASLRTFFEFLVREGTVETNPAKLVATLRIERKRAHRLSVEDGVRVSEAMDVSTDLSKRDRAIIDLL